MLRLGFWTAVGLVLHTHVLYPLLARVLAWGRPGAPAPGGGWEPQVSLIVAAHDEEEVIGRKVADALDLDYPPDRLEVIVASDGSSDATVQRAREAAAAYSAGNRVHVLDLPRMGKVAAQNAAVAEARGEVLAFSDANSWWDGDALRGLVAALGEPDVGYACGELRLLAPGGDSQEGVYWRYELWLRDAESRMASVTAGNGAIYATRAEAYVHLDPRMGHDLALPTAIVRGGRRALFAPAARAAERPEPDTGGELRRKRRMMGRAWLILIKGRLWDPRGVPPRYAFALLSHRVLRYTSPLWHLVALVASASLAMRGAGRAYRVAVAAQLALAAAAFAGGARAARPLRLVRYYVLITLAPALGLWDAIREGVGATWESPDRVAPDSASVASKHRMADGSH